MEDNAKKIIEVIADELSMDESEITLESTFTDDLGADSLDVCQIIMRLEDMYKITIDDAANITKIIHKGVEYSSIADFKASL